MTSSRRTLLQLAAGGVATAVLSRPARAQGYPERPVRLIVPSAAGSAPDITGRLMAQWLTERIGQQVVVDNRPGAGQNVGTEAAVRAPADGYTILLATTANTINATLYDRLSFDFIRDTTPIAAYARVPNVMVVNPSVPAHTVPEFIVYAKANPGKINMASAGNGTTPHLAGELFKQMAGISMLHVPYRGGTPALTDLLGGQMQVMFDVLPSSIGHIRAGRLRALAVTTATRVAALPDVPAINEFVPGYEVSSWSGFVAPAKTPDAVVAKLNSAINSGLADPNIAARLAAIGAAPMAMTPVEFGRLVADETKKWAGVIRTAHITSD